MIQMKKSDQTRVSENAKNTHTKYLNENKSYQKLEKSYQTFPFRFVLDWI